MRRIVESEAAPAAIGPYSQAVTFGKLLFTSGQIPLDPETGEIAGPGIEEQARQVFRNLDAVLEAGGSHRSNLLKVTIFLSDLSDFGVVNRLYEEWLGSVPPPARSCLQAAALPKGVRIEVEAVAALKEEGG
ncbi:MAG: RidA family protein [Candidatus Hydrogenedentota bacterium]|nr:MAG: RidA family protein [Candidatus Hydrogenedentota bacterium]